MASIQQKCADIWKENALDLVWYNCSSCCVLWGRWRSQSTHDYRKQRSGWSHEGCGFAVNVLYHFIHSVCIVNRLYSGIPLNPFKLFDDGWVKWEISAGKRASRCLDEPALRAAVRQTRPRRGVLSGNSEAWRECRPHCFEFCHLNYCARHIFH